MAKAKSLNNMTLAKVARIRLPSESFGECVVRLCHTVGHLADGLCQRCWDATGDVAAGIRPSKAKNAY